MVEKCEQVQQTEVRQKEKGRTRRPFPFWWNRRGFSRAEYTRTFRLTSELADLQVGYVNPIRVQSTRAGSTNGGSSK